MRRLFLALALWLAAAASAEAAVAWVQNSVDAIQQGDGATTTFTFNFKQNSTSGDGFGAVIQIDSGALPSSVKDNFSTNWPIQNTSSTNLTMSVGIASVAHALASITVTFSSAPAGGDNIYVLVDEISGANAIDAHHTTHSASGSLNYSDNVTTTHTTLLYGLSNILPGTGGTITAGTGTLHSSGTNSTSGESSSSQAGVAAGAQTVTFHVSVADPFTVDVFTIAFTDGTGGGGIKATPELNLLGVGAD